MGDSLGIVARENERATNYDPSPGPDCCAHIRVVHAAIRLDQDPSLLHALVAANLFEPLEGLGNEALPGEAVCPTTGCGNKL